MWRRRDAAERYKFKIGRADEEYYVCCLPISKIYADERCDYIKTSSGDIFVCHNLCKSIPKRVADDNCVGSLKII